jgi:hypothetical protein
MFVLPSQGLRRLSPAVGQLGLDSFHISIKTTERNPSIHLPFFGFPRSSRWATSADVNCGLCPYPAGSIQVLRSSARITRGRYNSRQVNEERLNFGDPERSKPVGLVDVLILDSPSREGGGKALLGLNQGEERACPETYPGAGYLYREGHELVGLRLVHKGWRTLLLAFVSWKDCS